MIQYASDATRELIRDHADTLGTAQRGPGAVVTVTILIAALAGISAPLTVQAGSGSRPQEIRAAALTLASTDLLGVNGQQTGEPDLKIEMIRVPIVQRFWQVGTHGYLELSDGALTRLEGTEFLRLRDAGPAIAGVQACSLSKNPSGHEYLVLLTRDGAIEVIDLATRKSRYLLGASPRAPIFGDVDFYVTKDCFLAYQFHQPDSRDEANVSDNPETDEDGVVHVFLADLGQNKSAWSRIARESFLRLTEDPQGNRYLTYPRTIGVAEPLAEDSRKSPHGYHLWMTVYPWQFDPPETVSINDALDLVKSDADNLELTRALILNSLEHDTPYFRSRGAGYALDADYIHLFEQVYPSGSSGHLYPESMIRFQDDDPGSFGTAWLDINDLLSLEGDLLEDRSVWISPTDRFFAVTGAREVFIGSPTGKLWRGMLSIPAIGAFFIAENRLVIFHEGLSAISEVSFDPLIELAEP